MSQDVPYSDSNVCITFKIIPRCDPDDISPVESSASHFTLVI